MRRTTRRQTVPRLRTRPHLPALRGDALDLALKGAERLAGLLDRLAQAEARLATAEAEIERLKELHLAVAHAALARDPMRKIHV